MSTNLVDELGFREDIIAVVYLVEEHNGEGSYEPELLKLTEWGAMVRYQTTTGVSPDPVTITEYTILVPWNQIKQIRQTRAV